MILIMKKIAHHLFYFGFILFFNILHSFENTCGYWLSSFLKTKSVNTTANQV